MGTFVVVDTQSIANTAGAGGVGPRLFPYLIGVGLTLCGAVLGWQAISRRLAAHGADVPEHARPDWTAFALISVGIVLHMVVIGWAGFVIAGTLLFVLTARGFGSRKPVRDAASRCVLSICRLPDLHARPRHCGCRRAPLGSRLDGDFQRAHVGVSRSR